MKKGILLCVFALAAGISSTSAQVLGRVINAHYFDSSHRLMFSQNDYVYGTSRSAAMGGAFASLGADLSSMNINPAGLGMYQSSDWGVTQSVSINSMTTAVNQTVDFSSGGNRTSYGLDNIGMAYNVFNSSRGLTSLTLGFSFNRTANFNSRSYTSSKNEKVSIGDMFFEQLDILNADGYGPSSLNPSQRPFDDVDIELYEWSAILGYQSGLIGTNSSGGFHNYFSDDTRTDSYMQSVTKGGIYEYSFSLGTNIDNILYLGATLGLSQVNYREDLTYEESYTNNPGGFRDMWFDQSTKINGVGFSMKLGAIVRPVSALRIGLAFHLPTYYSLEKSYYGEMAASGASRSTGTWIDDQLRFNSAPRLLAGISYVVADKAIVSVDYERTWYNKIHTRDASSLVIEDSKNESRELYNPGNTIRAGIEILASDVLSLRAGGGYSMDFMTNDDWVMNNPTVKSYYTVSGGLGFNLGRNAYIDVTYVFKRSEYTKYDLYYFKDDYAWAYQYDNAASYDPYGGNSSTVRDYTPTKKLHQIMLTFGSRF